MWFRLNEMAYFRVEQSALVSQPWLAGWSVARWWDCTPFLVMLRGGEDQEPHPELVHNH